MSNRRKPSGQATLPRTRPAATAEASGSSRAGQAVRLGVIGVLSVVLVVVIVLLVLPSGHKGKTSAAGTSKSSVKPAPSATSVVNQTPKTPGEKWQQQVLDDFGPLSAVLLAYDKSVGGWATGSVSAASAAGQIHEDLPSFQQAATALARQAPFAQAPQALADYQLSVALYIEAARYALAATAVPTGPAQTQLRLAYQRIQNLGDRIYDQATVVLEPYAPTPQSGDGVVIQTPPDVPDWNSLGLAAGPPFAAAPRSDPPQTYQTTRPQEPFAAWAAAVSRAGIPAPSVEAAAIRSGTAQTLETLSSQFAGAVTTLNATPDPAHARPTSTRLRLGLLVDAEATRAAEAADLVPAQASTFRTVAETLALLGDRLWDPSLGARATGFPQSLLTGI